MLTQAIYDLLKIHATASRDVGDAKAVLRNNEEDLLKQLAADQCWDALQIKWEALA